MNAKNQRLVRIALTTVLVTLAFSGLSFVLAEDGLIQQVATQNGNNAKIVLPGEAEGPVPGEEVAEDAGEGSNEEHNFPLTFLWITIILIAAKLSSLIERWGQPAVLGELTIGIILGNLTLAGIHAFEVVKQDTIIAFLAELGVVILLFQIGLESNIHEMKKVGIRAFLVACIGVVVPFGTGTWIVGPWLMPGLSFNSYLFLGAALTATSVGITARVFRDLGKLQTKEAQIVLGAAVIDDILGLIILAVVSAIVTVGAVSIGIIGWIFAKAMLFLIVAIVFGQLLAHPVSKFFSMVHTGVGMKFTLAIAIGLIFAYAAKVFGLEPIVGAFAAGLILDSVHFRYFRDPTVVEDIREIVKDEPTEIKSRITKALGRHADRHIEDLIEPVSYLFVPIFFVVTGMGVQLATLGNLKVILVALGITAVAFIGKIVAGIAAGKGSNKWLVGWGMVPRGEVGLIFAAIGVGLGVITPDLFSVIVVMVILTTLLTPPILTALLRKADGKMKAA